MAEDGAAYNHVRRIDKVKVRVVNVRVSDPGEFSTRAKVDTWAVAAATYNMQVIPHVPTVIAWLKSFPQTTSECLGSLPRTNEHRMHIADPCFGSGTCTIGYSRGCFAKDEREKTQSTVHIMDQCAW
jgi:hypothetical protein